MSVGQATAPTRRRKRALLTREQLATAWGVHARTVAKWQEEGLPVAVRGRGGRASRYDQEECDAWKAAREALAVDEGPVDLTRERARKERAQALLAEQLYAVRSGKLLDAALVEKAWAAEIAAARAVVLSSYTAAADRVYRAAVTDGLGGVERELKALAFAVLRELAGGADTRKRKRKKAA